MGILRSIVLFILITGLVIWISSFLIRGIPSGYEGKNPTLLPINGQTAIPTAPTSTHK
jgi:hypothetical protein